MSRELIFSVRGKDCTWTYYRGSGAGGQKRNKTSSAARCFHPQSGAVGASEDHRSQRQNKREAFIRMLKTPKFKVWMADMVAQASGRPSLDELVERSMQSKNLLVEVCHDDEWVKETE